MDRTTRGLALTALTLSLASTTGSVCAEADQQPPRSAPATGLALDRLKELDSPKASAPERASLGLRMYRDEMLHPCAPPKPPYTELKTHDFVLAQITRKLASSGADVASLKKTWSTMNPGEVKDSLSIFLVLKGDSTPKDAVATYVVDRTKPLRLRELGVEALGKLAVKTQDPKVGDVMAQVLREDTQGQYQKATGGKAGSGMLLVYPVRRAAKAAVGQMDKAGLLLPSYVTQAAERAQLEIPLPEPKQSKNEEKRVPAPASSPK